MLSIVMNIGKYTAKRTASAFIRYIDSCFFFCCCCCSLFMLLMKILNPVNLEISEFFTGQNEGSLNLALRMRAAT